MKLLQNDKIALQFNSSAYQLLEKIGEGGFGHVYLAKQINTGQSVAIKFLSIRCDFDENKRARYIERFERETLLGSRLQHPNIVRLLDKGNSGSLLFAVFEYIAGKTLKQKITESGPLSAIEATDVMTQVLDALAHAHQQGVVHRDIKPANIMLSESAAKLHVKVLDFGIGTLVSEARVQDYKSITLTQETLGTPSYSSPEQLRGEPATIKTDLYVWGLVFLECLTGKPAMSGGNLASIFHKQLSPGNVALPAAIVGHPLAALLRRVLQKKAHLRSVNAADLYHEIQQINVANLVGELQAENDKRISKTNIIVDNDATLIHENPIFNTGQIESKQITVLALCLNAKAVEGKEINHEVIDALHRDQKNQCLDTAIRYGAFHVGSLGDTQLFYFGYPAVSDNDARLCARTALDLISDLNKRNALLKMNQGIQIDIKIGIHTGLLTCYADATPEGDTANIALQLARLAGNEKILCSNISQKLLQSYIEFKPLSSQPLGVASTPIALFNLVAERHVEAFGFLRAAQNNHQFIGREKEFKSLLALQAPESRYKLAHVVGEAGIGKSRLTFEFRNQSKQTTHFIGQCLPEHINNALYPILNILKYKYALTSLTVSAAIEKLSAEIGTLAEVNLTDILPILCAWLGYALPEEIAPSALSPDLQKQLLFKTLVALLNKQDNAQANLFIFEDMHWADPTSLEFIKCLSLSKAFTDSGNLFISTSRLPLPEMLDSDIYQSIPLQKLTEQDSKDFVNNLFDKQNVANQLMEAVVSRTDGIPLFIEELVDMLKQKGLVQHLNGITDFIDSDKLNELPSSLRESLQQKLDSLVYSKETAQLAATIGREFDYDLLVACSNRSEAQLQTELDELISADIILQKRRVSGDSYLFKHALVRDAAYESMSRIHTIKNHLSVAKLLEVINSNFNLIALHYRKALDYEKSVMYGIQYVSSLLEKHIYESSKKYIDQVVIDNEKISESLCQLNNKVKINKLTSVILMAIDGYGSEAIKAINQNNEDLNEQITKINSIQIGAMEKHINLWQKGQVHHMVSERDEAYKLFSELVSDARNDRCRRRLVDSLPFLGLCLTTGGKLEESLIIYEEALALYDKKIDFDICLTNGIDPKCHALVNMALALALLDKFKEAQDKIDEAMKYSQVLNHGLCLAITHCYQMYILAVEGNKKSVLQQETIQNEFFELNPDLSFLQAYSKAIIEWAKNETEFQQQFSKSRVESGQTYLHSFYETLLATSYKESGDEKKCEQVFKDVIDWCNESGEFAFKNYISKFYNNNMELVYGK
ncbi:TOMM system kinase/cyclase fusion protein [Psychromonas hadalis]|uniref:TOMM system kinase/cyclase fusion protein n=1 Tax=Psychromonas hadalis TaxID=211669 RepID=UPI0003B349E4|nr:TOMM system kinase/cyclase fusion protein [Psychromonas hadalis]